MSKEALKQSKIGPVAHPELVDTHRYQHKAQGGTYDCENYGVMDPVSHMRFHGTFREREEFFENLKARVDDRNQVLKLRNKANNQLLAYKRKTDHLLPETVEWLEEQSKQLTKDEGNRRRKVAKAMKDYAQFDALAQAALGVSGVGEITIALCLVYINLNKARHASSLWSYCGLDKPSHARYTKTEASGGNKTLRTALYTMADSIVKTRGAYRSVYDRTKERLSNSEKVTKSRNTQGQLIECAWKDTKPCHRHGAALRAVMKHFLADYWYVGRSLMGLPNGPCYAEAQLAGNHKTVNPKERGWVW